MKLIFDKKDIYAFLFGLCIIVPYLNNHSLAYAVWLFTFLGTIRYKYSLAILKVVFSFFAIFTISVVVGVINQNPFYEYIRDFTYLTKPIIGLLVGYQLFLKKEHIQPFHTVIVTGVILALYHLILVGFSTLFYSVRHIHDLRWGAGYFSDYEVYALIIALFYKRFEIKIAPKIIRTYTILVALSVILYFSRTNYIQFFILFLALKGYFVLTKAALKKIFLVILLTLIGYSVIYNMRLSREGKGIEALLYKIKNAPIEAFKTDVDVNDWEDFNDNFRSYENITTLKQVSKDGITAILLGQGLGSTVDIGVKMRTNDGTLVRYEAVLHNAYFTVFLKSGIIGVFFCLYFIILLIKQKKTNNSLINQINYLLLGTGISLILANWVLLGLFLKLDNKAVLIGFLIAYKSYLQIEKPVINE
jgi:hypothetical protein